MLVVTDPIKLRAILNGGNVEAWGFVYCTLHHMTET